MDILFYAAETAAKSSDAIYADGNWTEHTTTIFGDLARFADALGDLFSGLADVIKPVVNTILQGFGFKVSD